MMTDPKPDPKALLAEREYLRQRRRELEDEHRMCVERINREGGTIAGEPAPAELEHLRTFLVHAVRRLGNAELADSWLAAEAAFEATEQHVEMLNEQHRCDAGQVTLEECVKAREAMSDALKELERVNAEVTAWLDRMGR